MKALEDFPADTSLTDYHYYAQSFLNTLNHIKSFNVIGKPEYIPFHVIGIIDALQQYDPTLITVTKYSL